MIQILFTADVPVRGLYWPSIVELFSSLLSSAADSDKPTVTMTNDRLTTSNLGDFYISVLLFRETDFHPSPIVPLAYVILDTNYFIKEITKFTCQEEFA